MTLMYIRCNYYTVFSLFPWEKEKIANDIEKPPLRSEGPRASPSPSTKLQKSNWALSSAAGAAEGPATCCPLPSPFTGYSKQPAFGLLQQHSCGQQKQKVFLHQGHFQSE